MPHKKQQWCSFISPFIVSVCIISKREKTHKYLLIRRSNQPLKGAWQIVTGKVKKEEQAWQTALRETKEETNLTIKHLYCSTFVETFYSPICDAIMFSPVFIGFVSASQKVKTNPKEHDDHKWLTYEEATHTIDMAPQKEAIHHIQKYFINQKPSKHLKILI